MTVQGEGLRQVGKENEKERAKESIAKELIVGL